MLCLGWSVVLTTETLVLGQGERERAFGLFGVRDGERSGELGGGSFLIVGVVTMTSQYSSEQPSTELLVECVYGVDLRPST